MTMTTQRPKNSIRLTIASRFTSAVPARRRKPPATSRPPRQRTTREGGPSIAWKATYIAMPVTGRERRAPSWVALRMVLLRAEARRPVAATSSVRMGTRATGTRRVRGGMSSRTPWRRAMPVASVRKRSWTR
jgi:hypothetical protein